MLSRVAFFQRLTAHARRCISHPKTPFIATAVAAVSALALLLLTVQNFYGLPLTVRVAVGPVDKIGVINEDTGCYRWRLPERLNRMLNHPRAQLLEDGRPLSRVMHVAAVEKVRGGHFMVRGAVVRFAAGDASDVRTNGRRYELILPRPVREHWLLACALLLALSLPLALPVLKPRLAVVAAGVNRLPVWVVAAAVMLVVAEDLVVNDERSNGAFLVKGLPESDAQGWYRFATGLAEGEPQTEGFAHQRPLYAVLLASTMMGLGGASLLGVKVLNVLCLGLAAGAVFALSKALRHPWAGLATVAYLGFGSDHLHQWHTVQTENAGLAFTAVATLALAAALVQRSIKRCLLAGALAGMGNLAAGHVLMALPLAAVLIAVLGLLARGQRRVYLLMVVAFTFGASAMLVPWMVFQKQRNGVFTISMNSAELLAGMADPVHGKLSGELLGKAMEKGLSPDSWQARYSYFMDLFKQEVAEDPGRVVKHVLRGTWQSLNYVEMDDAVLRTLLALGLILAGAVGVWRWRSPQPLMLAGGLIFYLVDHDTVLPGWVLFMLGACLLLQRRSRAEVLVLLAIGVSVVGCMAVSGLAGNVATRRFWLVMDWALVLAALAGLGLLLDAVCSWLARVPILGYGMQGGEGAERSVSTVKEEVLTCRPALAVVVISLLATGVVLGRLAAGPRVVFDPVKLSALAAPALEPGQTSYLLYFDDHVMHLTRDEDVEHWLPHYQPVNQARWLAFPRLIKPDGTLGGRMALEKFAKSDEEVPRWQAAYSVCRLVQRNDAITGLPTGLSQVEKIEVLALE